MTLTHKEEIALAILLWKNWRQRKSRSGKKADKTINYSESVRSEIRDLNCVGEKVGYQSIKMAEVAGVKEEFFKLLTLVPIMSITIRELEPWLISCDSERPLEDGFPNTDLCSP